MKAQNLNSPPSPKNELTNGRDKSLMDYQSREKCRENKLTSVEKSTNESEESIVKWKQTNIKEGFVIVDEGQLSKLIKREPIEKYYELEQEPFAKGLFTSVRKCQSLETGESFAAKFTSRNRYGEDCSREIYHEIAVLSLCGSAPRIIQIHDVFENPKEIIIVMEYAPGGDLQTIIDENLVPFESDVMSFVRQTAEGLDYLHRRRIAHLDIKPQNIVMMGDYPNCEIKLCDFEISRVILEGKDVRELLGTPDYVAPEILHYDPITLAADMWSLGVTTYVLLTGFSPFGGDTDQETFFNISRGELDFPEDLFKDVSVEAVNFLRGLLVKNPKARMTASACLKHPWFEAKPKSDEIEKTTVDESNSKEDGGETWKTAENGEGKSGTEVKDEEMATGSKRPCPSDVTLRKYLSKSREALFENVARNRYNSQKRNTIKSHRFRKTRMCESQISLISKSQEKLLAGESFIAQNRSIEKLYGLRSLSRSQEVLNLYKCGGFLASHENLNLVSEIIMKSGENLSESGFRGRKLKRATTSDLASLRDKNEASTMFSCSSTTSLASFGTVNATEDEEDEEEKAREKGSGDSVFDEKCPEKRCDEMRDGEKDAVNGRSVMREIEKLENRQKLRNDLANGDDEEEPRFTVAQLITAYNKHQEIVTKTSLEVTMSSVGKKVKIPPMPHYESKSTFPTGPTALRLFIPDIDLVSMPKKNVPNHVMRFPEESEKNSGRISEYESSRQDFRESNFASNENGCERNQKKETSKKKMDGENASGFPEGKKSSSPIFESNQTESPRFFPTADDEPENQKFDSGKSISGSSGKPTGKKSSDKCSATTGKCQVEKIVPFSRKGSNRLGKPEESIRKKPESSTRYKIVGIGERNSSGKNAKGVSYKIEFDSPVVKRKFPIRNIPTKATISSNLKARETFGKPRK